MCDDVEKSAMYILCVYVMYTCNVTNESPLQKDILRLLVYQNIKNVEETRHE